MKHSTFAKRTLCLITASYVAMVGGTALAQDQSADEEGLLEEVVVTGYRQSLEAALDLKRDAVGSVDAIFAEDIADFPDSNLAESLQRIPGVTITRDSGEGREISVRGLSGEFTRVRVNGIEAVSATGGEGGPNRSRSFDFNVFASELFNQLVVHKTASANLDEGSLGAVVDLNTGRPFQYDEGATFVVSGEMQYNELNEDWGPRAAALWAYHDPDGGWGASFSAAYSDNTTVELGQNTVRWQRASFNSVRGVDCGDNPGDAGCAEVAGAFHPRIPRYGQIEYDRERLGLTASVQFAPSDSTTITFDGLYSEYDASRGEIWGEVLFRGNEGGMDVLDYVYDASTNNLNYMAVNNAWVRNENFLKAWTTEFYQAGLNLDHDFNDTLRAHVLVGTSNSELDFPYEITFMYDDRDYNNFVYDYRDDQFPTIAFNGPNVADATNFTLTELRDRPAYVEHGFDTIAGELIWDFYDGFSLEAGVNWKEFSYNTTGSQRDTTVCGSDLYNCDTDGDGVNDVLGVPATDAMSDLYTFDDDMGPGSTNTWAVPNLQAWIDYFNLFSLPARLDQGNTAAVTEENTALFVQLNGELMFGSMPFRFNTGVRWVETDQSSSGYNSGSFVTVDRDPYDDLLPSFNAALDITPDLVARFSMAEVLTRPALGNLSPGGSVDSFNYRVSYDNPFLEPTRADAIDISLEWYFADEAVLGFSYFYKDIESRPISTQREGTYASTGLPLSLLNPTSPAGQCPECQEWTISSIDNGPGGELDGFEVAFQMPLSVLTENTPFIRNLGVIANYTYVDSSVDYTFGSETVTERLFGLSNDAWNATLYYETERFNARISASYRDEYLTGTSGNSNRFEGYGAVTWVDFSAGWDFTEHLSAHFEALNLTDEYQDRWTDIDAKRRYEYDHTGRIFKVGLRYAY